MCCYFLCHTGHIAQDEGQKGSTAQASLDTPQEQRILYGRRKSGALTGLLHQVKRFVKKLAEKKQGFHLYASAMDQTFNSSGQSYLAVGLSLITNQVK